MRPDTLFERDGYEHLVTVPITFRQAVTVPDVVFTIDGKVQYTCLRARRAAQCSAWRGKGIQYVNGRSHGDQYAKVVVEMVKSSQNAARGAAPLRTH